MHVYMSPDTRKSDFGFGIRGRENTFGGLRSSIKPTKIYVKPVLKALQNSININAIAHITGGGIIDNLKRVFSKNYGFIISGFTSRLELLRTIL